jgi:TonB-dependent receptor-like protein/carboxypeptidase-like protein
LLSGYKKHLRKLLIVLLIWLANYTPVIAQNEVYQSDSTLISANFKEAPIIQVIDYLEISYQLRFFYQKEWLIGKFIDSFAANNVALETALQILLQNTGLSFSVVDGDYIMLFQGKTFFATTPDIKTQSISLTGRVTLANADTPLPNVVVFVDDLKLGTVTNMEGFYQITLPPGNHVVVYKSMEVLAERYDFPLSKINHVLNVELFEKNRQLEEVIVTGSELNENLASIDVGKVQLNKEFFRKLPSLLGEIDINRVVKSLPGVQTVGEGTTDFNVRGGNRDQNLILMDGIPIYNTSHLLGFFSVFNPDLISSFTLYKGSIPANYGGRLSSVLTVDLKNPNTDNFELEGGIGFVSDRLSLNIPLAKKHSIRIAGRYSDPTWILRQVKDPAIKESSARYYDLNFKYRYVPDDKSVFVISSFYSRDDFNFAGTGAGFNYDNLGASAKYIRNFSPKLSTQLKVAVIDYTASAIDQADSTSSSIFTTGINNFVFSGDLDYKMNENIHLNGGIESTLSNYDLGQTTPADEVSEVKNFTIPAERSIENALFIKSELDISPKIRLGVGIRYSVFSNLGPLTEYVFDDNKAKSATSIIDTLVSTNNQIVRSFSGFEPRISATYLLKEDLSLKLSYSRTRQYQYLFSNSAASLPVDIWKPTDNNIPVQIADQVSLGMVTKLKMDMYDLSTDIYYKRLPSTAILKIGVPAINNKLLVADVVNADGFSYGTEFLLRKIRGNFTGFLAYTYSVAKTRVLSDFPGETINNREFFRSDFDSPHNLSVSVNLKVNKLLTFSANFLYNTGRPVTIPTASFTSDNVRVFSITARNNFRIPDTHRLDLAMTIEGSYKKNRRWHGSWIFSVYNVYGRKNPFSVYLRAENNTQPRLIQLSVLGNIFPSITYNFKLIPLSQTP